jgi:hypothetical protein
VEVTSSALVSIVIPPREQAFLVYKPDRPETTPVLLYFVTKQGELDVYVSTSACEGELTIPSPAVHDYQLKIASGGGTARIDAPIFPRGARSGTCLVMAVHGWDVPGAGAAQMVQVTVVSQTPLFPVRPSKDLATVLSPVQAYATLSAGGYAYYGIALQPNRQALLVINAGSGVLGGVFSDANPALSAARHTTSYPLLAGEGGPQLSLARIVVPMSSDSRTALNIAIVAAGPIGNLKLTLTYAHCSSGCGEQELCLVQPSGANTFLCGSGRDALKLAVGQEITGQVKVLPSSAANLEWWVWLLVGLGSAFMLVAIILGTWLCIRRRRARRSGKGISLGDDDLEKEVLAMEKELQFEWPIVLEVEPTPSDPRQHGIRLPSKMPSLHQMQTMPPPAQFAKVNWETPVERKHDYGGVVDDEDDVFNEGGEIHFERSADDADALDTSYDLPMNGLDDSAINASFGGTPSKGRTTPSRRPPRRTPGTARSKR